ncbi:NYN domain-containing protein [Oscillatoria sp. FACHB-1406]|uniref:NYN domain-containing protein n=1 Tax=Oscillatoria sp. FACHB-1406 TaxID=2692846 RepID=UPI001687D784|nr:NYN domain-containing protein [Oscillatoria sp. FACHB-1406]MBD2576630.1 NYN domain-containing protein [Oscillatoria sp. FACHB-1406]
MNAIAPSSSEEHPVFLYWDAQNVRFPKHSNPTLLIQQILTIARQLGTLEIVKAYAYWCKESKDYHKSFYELGFECPSVPDEKKNEVDRKIIEDCRKQVLKKTSKSIVILVSGDEDFSRLLKELRAEGNQVIAIGNSKATQKLREAATFFYELNDLDRLECSLSQKELEQSFLEPTSQPSQLSYLDAVNCLQQAVEKVLQSKKSGCLGRVDSMMRKTNNLYRGVASIASKDGKKFKCFKCFVEAVAAEGKITLVKTEKHLELALTRG